MHIKQLLVCVFSSLIFGGLKGQLYRSDSLNVEITEKNNFTVDEFADLNIDIIYSSQLKNRNIWIYERLEWAYKAPYGNFYFELSKYDTSFGYRNITLDVIGIAHPFKEFKNAEEILRHDLIKTPLAPGKKKVFTFNLLNYVSRLDKGHYSMRVYLRNRNNYGYNNDGKVVANSILYLESVPINFEVLQNVKASNKIQ